MKTLSLNGEYTLKSSDGVYSLTANIPGSDFGALIADGIIEDPMNAKDGEKLADEIARKDFTFEREFNVEEDFSAYAHVDLCFERLDTICKAYLNGELILESCNAHISYCVDVKEKLKNGKNTIKLCFASPVLYCEKRQKERAMPANTNGLDGAQFLRKPNCHFGWDWGPYIPFVYCGNTEIKFYNRKIDNIDISQQTTAEKSVVTVSADNADNIYIITPDGEKIEGVNGEFIINNPALWQIKEFDSKREKQPLYTVVIENDEETVKRRIGLRSIQLDRSKDTYGENFQFYLNGHSVFAKGANVIPFSAIPEYGKNDSVEYYIKLVASSNYNMLRIWGGGEYASDYLLDLCDELGILIWQDFCFACMMYPFDEADFIDNITAEALQNINRIKHHPCLALLCGNNEIEEMQVLQRPTKAGKGYVNWFYNILPKLVSDNCDLPYIPTSPVGKGAFEGNKDESSGDCHMWAVWHGLMPLDYYGGRYARFLSEFGMESLPSLKAIDKFAKGDNSVYSPAFMQHQKTPDGNRKLMYYLCEGFSNEVSFDLLPYLTGIMQAQCIEAAVNHFRQNKGRCNGAIYWQLNDVWNAPSWSAVDFEKVPKALMYKSKSFFAPVNITHDGTSLYLHNDTISDFTAKLEIEKYSADGFSLISKEEKTILVKAEKFEKIQDVSINLGEVLVVTANGTDKFIFDNAQNLPKANISCDISENEVTLSSDVYTRNVCIECDGVAEENYFTLLPGEKRTVKINGSTDNMRILCENNISFRRGLKQKLFRFFYKMKPYNAISALWHTAK